MMRATVVVVTLAVLPTAAFGLRLGTPSISRRALGVAAINAASLTFWPSQSASAYDSLPPPQASFESNEKIRIEREKRIAKNAQEIQPYLVAITKANTPEEYAKAVDNLSVWIIGKGSLPEGIDAPIVRDAIQDNWQKLPANVCVGCEVTRVNNGICCSPGRVADDAYYAGLKQLRKYATRKGKGSLMSDGVSAANSAAF